MKMDYSKAETMTKLMLTVPYSSVFFSYTLCACHMTGCHYIQPLFHSICAPCTADVNGDFRYRHKVDETCPFVGYCTASCGNL